MTNYNDNLLSQYQDSLKDYRDLKNTIDTYVYEGKQETKQEIALNAMKKGFDDNIIHELTGLPLAKIAQIRKEHNL